MKKALDELIGAVYRKDINAIRQLAGAINDVDSSGRTALMHAVLASDADEKTTRLLAELGTDVNVHDRNQKWTALHFAARDGRTAIVRELLMAGAEPNSVDSFGNTPLMRALMDTPNVESELIKLLLDHGADPDHTNLKGISPRQFAEQMKRVSAIEVFSAIGKR